MQGNEKKECAGWNKQVIAFLKSRPEVKTVMLEDDTFIVSKPRTLDLANELIRRGNKLPFDANCRADIGADVDRADDHPQITCDRLLQRKQFDRIGLDALAHRGNVLVVGDHLLGHREVRPQQRLRRAFHRVGGKPAHVADLCG